MAETHGHPEQFTLRLRRYDPESGEAPYWDEHTVELEPHRSVLEAILQARDRFDGSIGIRCSCRQAICGSCGVRINGEPALACHTHLDAAKAARRDGVIEIEPMGNMPVIKDLIVDMDAVHWKKIQRVTPWLIAKQPVPEREYIVAREAMVDVTQTMACIQCGACVSDCLAMEVDPGFIGPAALAKAYRFVGDPRDDQQCERLQRPRPGPPGDLRLHALLQVRGGVPEGRQPDGPDHAPAADRERRPAHRRPEQRRAPRGGVHDAGQGQRPAVGGRAAARAPTAATRGSANSPPPPAKSCSARCRSILKALLRGKVTPMGALKPHKIPKPDLKACRRSTTRSRAARSATS